MAIGDNDPQIKSIHPHSDSHFPKHHDEVHKYDPRMYGQVVDDGTEPLKLTRESEQMLWYAACAELNSEHIIGRAIVQYASSLPTIAQLVQPTSFMATTGKGITCHVESREVVVGTIDFIRECNVQESLNSGLAQYSIEASNDGCTTIYVAMDGVLQGLIELSDPPRDESETTVAALRSAVRVKISPRAIRIVN